MIRLQTFWIVVAVAALGYAGLEFLKTSNSGMPLEDKQSAFIRFLIALAIGLFAGFCTMSR